MLEQAVDPFWIKLIASVAGGAAHGVLGFLQAPEGEKWSFRKIGNTLMTAALAGVGFAFLLPGETPQELVAIFAAAAGVDSIQTRIREGRETPAVKTEPPK